MKKLLIITPLFPPINSPDTQRVRITLPFFKNLGWEPIVVTVKDVFAEGNKDYTLEETIPKDIGIFKLDALSLKFTRKVGLGNIGIRSIPYYVKFVNKLLKNTKIDLIYFSTTQFPVCILGRYWKQRFGIPYVIDMQDPWHSEYYLNKPKHDRPPKFWFSYRLNKYLEAFAMKKVDGLIAVSEAYNRDLLKRYNLDIPVTTIPFGAYKRDVAVAKENSSKYPSIIQKDRNVQISYIGRGGYDMHEALKILFSNFKLALQNDKEYFSKFYFNFLGTSYAPKEKSVKTIEPIATNLGIKSYVYEDPDRMPFYQAINTLASSDILFICGSNDEKYTASKIFPYLQLEKPLLAIFNEKSSVVEILTRCSNATVVTFQESEQSQYDKIVSFLRNYTFIDYSLNEVEFYPYTAEVMAKKQVDFFNSIIGENINNS